MTVLVRILPSDDAVFDDSYVGKLGIVTRLIFDSSWPVGETLDDPLFAVRFSDGRSDGFWREELEIITSPSKDAPRLPA